MSFDHLWNAFFYPISSKCKNFDLVLTRIFTFKERVTGQKIANS